MSAEDFIKLTDKERKEIESLVSSGEFKSGSEVIRTALRQLKENHPEYRIEIAVQLFKDDEISLGRAAEISGMERESFKEIIDKRGIKRKLEYRERSEDRINEVKG